MQRIHKILCCKVNWVITEGQLLKGTYITLPPDTLEKKSLKTVKAKHLKSISLLVFLSTTDTVLGYLHAQDKSAGACSLSDS